MRPRQCNSIVLERTASLPPRARRARLGRDRSTERPSYPGQREPGTRRPTERDHTLPRREPRRGPGDLDAAKRQPTSQVGFGASKATAIGRRRRGYAEQPRRGTSRSLRPSGEEVRRAVEDSRIQESWCGNRAAASPSPHPQLHILSCCGLQVEGRVALSSDCGVRREIAGVLSDLLQADMSEKGQIGMDPHGGASESVSWTAR